MERVTADDVLAIMDNCNLDSDVIDVYILAANRFVTSVYTDDTITSEELKREIERWFTAHMITSTRFRMASKEKIGDAEITYTGKWETGLSSTPYGQMVMQLDTTGKIARTGKSSATILAVKSFEE